jgi:membrane-associated protease RseP (regulator of RpoE activity)
MALASDAQVATLGGTLVVRARLLPGIDPRDARLRRALAQWPGQSFLDEDEAGSDLLLLRHPTEGRTRFLLHAVLLLATAFTTLLAGALFEGVDPLSTRMVHAGGLALPMPTGLDLAALGRGAGFALPFLFVLLVHESGHWWAARAHGVRTSLPWFIPMPPYLSLVGTLGAFIRIRSPIARRSILLDIGAAGPWASLLASMPLVAWGLAHSTVVPGGRDPFTPFLVVFGGEPIHLGTSVLMELAAVLTRPGAADGLVHLHPVALAGWLGLFVTALNLLPLGQLDGGHVLYALGPRLQRRAGLAMLAVLLALGLLWWGWWLWALLAHVVNRGRSAHPPVLQEGPSPDRVRRAVGWTALLLFFLCLTPVPLRL